LRILGMIGRIGALFPDGTTILCTSRECVAAVTAIQPTVLYFLDQNRKQVYAVNTFYQEEVQAP
jgi:hypothetical protein